MEGQRRRQARGERRMAEILEAGARVFARLGFERSTTNAIAAEAGISPGSLYQFFPNKEAIAAALSDRYVTEMREAFENTDFAAITLDELLDRVVDPIVAFNVANPGFKALFVRPEMPEGLAKPAEPIQGALLGRIESILTARWPDRPAAERARGARTVVAVFKGMLPVVLAAAEGERETEVRELKKVLRGYLSTPEP